MSTIYRKKKLRPVQLVVLIYVVATFVSAGILRLPFMHKPGVSISFTDALFTAASSISVTGLTVISVSDVFNTAGLIVLIILFQIGGIGIMTLGTFFWLLFGQRIGLEQRMFIAADHNRPTLSGLVGLMRSILALAFVIELIGAVLLGTHTLLTGYHDHWYTAYFHGLFASVSAFTNAGFDLNGSSLIPFAHDYYYQIVTMLLIISGGIGFPVLLELKWKVLHRKERHRFSLLTKIAILMFGVLTTLGAVMFFVFEHNQFLADKNWHETLFYSLFHSVSSRSGGMTTMDIGALGPSTLMMLSGLMFIGASPSSVGGGIRTTTFFVMIAAVWSYMRGQRNSKVFGRELDEDDIRRSFIVFFVATALVFTAFVLLSFTDPFPLQQLIFEVCSAFGTTGLSTGITPELSIAGKIILITVMIIGRVGILNMLLLLKQEDHPVRIRYPKETVIVGQ
ncbi:potassium uptake TrkH family protein [Paenibacillus phyllosphaerae]|uniref:Potassium uptake TrkH family protein n=1 Tax=Paenibacillus phyllosphaerae TaxID=274593 RepID=A0A7W5FL81_9BACL|nr:TrkH family potassium uptake protein [Paenibacillus phyllosphaerae]MBB3108717.1 potassium uptake TrkH family protein [Paenibacillus phyllosphaerae]